MYRSSRAAPQTQYSSVDTLHTIDSLRHGIQQLSLDTSLERHASALLDTLEALQVGRDIDQSSFIAVFRLLHQLTDDKNRLPSVALLS
jgi:hypothetical protein